MKGQKGGDDIFWLIEREVAGMDEHFGRLRWVVDGEGEAQGFLNALSGW